MTNDITILTVNFNSDFLLRFSTRLIHKFNKDLNIRHIVIKNSGEISNKQLFNQKIEFIPGINLEGAKEVSNKNQNLTTRPFPSPCWHHAGGLNEGLKQNIDSRFVMTLDPDCFVFVPLSTVIDYMEEHNLTFFGVPYQWWRHEKVNKDPQ
jgi:hypothetical protein